jgi:hypothetical protein
MTDRARLEGALAGVALERASERLRSLRAALRSRAETPAGRRFLAAELTRALPLPYQALRSHLERRPVSVAGAPVQPLTRVLLGERLDIPVALVRAGPVRLRPFQASAVERSAGWERSAAVRIRRLLGGRVDDKVCFAARGVELTATGAVVDGGLTSYGSALATQDDLEWELLDQAARLLEAAAGRGERPDPAALTGRLRRRLAAEAAATGDLLAGPGRCNALALATAVVYPEGDEFKVMVGRRAAVTGAHAGLCHVLPAGMLQPELGHPREEWDLRHGFLKEYGEELFSEELDGGRRDPAYFLTEWPAVRALLRALDDGRCTFQTTGLVVNLCNLRPEVCALLLVRDPSWWAGQQARQRANWEFDRGRAWTALRLAHAEADFLGSFGATPGGWAPSGLAALWLGVDAARRQLG